MVDAKDLSSTPTTVELRRTCKKINNKLAKLILKIEDKVGNVVEAIDRAATDLGANFKGWLGETEVFFVETKEVRRIPVKMTGTDVNHYQGMTHKETNQTHTTEHINSDER